MFFWILLFLSFGTSLSMEDVSGEKVSPLAVSIFIVEGGGQPSYRYYSYSLSIVDAVFFPHGIQLSEKRYAVLKKIAIAISRDYREYWLDQKEDEKSIFSVSLSFEEMDNYIRLPDIIKGNFTIQDSRKLVFAKQIINPGIRYITKPRTTLCSQSEDFNEAMRQYREQRERKGYRPGEIAFDAY